MKGTSVLVSGFIVLIVRRAQKQVSHFFVPYNNHAKILGEGAFKINFSNLNAVVRRKCYRGVLTALSHLEALCLLSIVESGYVKIPI